MTAAQVRTHKTDAIMRLLTGNNIAVNPMLDNEFKESVFSVHRNAEAYKKEKEREEAALRLKEKAAQRPTEINVVSELITEMLPEILQRFRCCGCSRCFAEAMTDAMDTIPSVTIKLRSEADVARAEELKSKSRKDVMSALIKLAISRRNLPKHRS